MKTNLMLALKLKVMKFLTLILMKLAIFTQLVATEALFALMLLLFQTRKNTGICVSHLNSAVRKSKQMVNNSTFIAKRQTLEEFLLLLLSLSQ
jgi:hypothetical protein